MGALTSNRKRGDESVTVNLKSSVSYSPFSEFHVSKKPRLLPSFNEINDRPSPVNTVLNFFRYPISKSEFKREPHAPVRRHRAVNSVNFKRNGFEVSYVDNSAQEMGNWLASRHEERYQNARAAEEVGNSRASRYEETYQNAKKSALETIRYAKEDSTVIEVDEVAEDVVSEDSSIEEIEMLEDENYQKSKESDGVLEDPQKFDGMIVERDSRPSTSSAETNLTSGNLKVKSPEKLLESLQLDGEYDVTDARVHKKLLYMAERRNAKLNFLKFEIELEEKQWHLQQLLRPKKKEEVINKDVASEAFKPLTKEEEAKVARALSNSSRRKLLVSHESSNISITGEVLQCLRPGAWLNDEVINLYLELLKERERREPEKFLKCHFFSTFFYKKLVSGKSGYNYQSVRRWTSQRKLGYCIYDCDKIFVPIHKQVHWCLAVINKKDKKFQYLDSLGKGDNQVMKAVSKYFADEVKDKSGKEINVSSWQKENVEDLPEQANGFDCGVFMIKYADFYSRDIGLCFSQEHMPYFRLRTAKEILSLKAE